MYSTGFTLDPVKDVPMDEQKKASGLSIELQQEEHNQYQTFEKTITLLGDEYQKKLHEITGHKNLENYFEFRSPMNKRMRDVVSKAEPTFAGESEIKEARLKAAEESREFMGKIGFDMALASKMRGEYHDRMGKEVDKYLGKPEKPNYLVFPEDVPDDVHNPWAIYRPPYPGSAWAYSWYRSDEPNTPSFARYLNRFSGQLGTYSSIRVSGADDSDSSWVNYRTAMRFWYHIPAAGMAELWMRLQCISTPYSGWLDDEWGWSDSACDQESHAYVRVISPSLGAFRFGTILDYRRTGTDASWSNQTAAPGAHRWAHLFSSDSYPAGTWLLLEVGTREWNHFWSNDVSIHSAMTQRWFLDSVYVQSTG